MHEILNEQSELIKFYKKKIAIPELRLLFLGFCIPVAYKIDPFKTSMGNYRVSINHGLVSQLLSPYEPMDKSSKTRF